jgi:hypothetical protein
VTITVTKLDGGWVEEELRTSGFTDFLLTRKFQSRFDAQQRIQEAKLPLGLYLVEFSPYVSAAHFPAARQEWSARSASLSMGHPSVRSKTTVLIKSAGEENVRVPAGEFRALRVDAHSGSVNDSIHGQTRVVVSYWYVPQLRRCVKIVRRHISMASTVNSVDTFELAKYRVADAD